MPKWSDMVMRVIPWLATDKRDEQRAEQAAAVTAEQEALAPLIQKQADYLVRKGEINGFTRQLQIGFQRRIAGE